jgi:type IV secretion system protein VirB9
MKYALFAALVWTTPLIAQVTPIPSQTDSRLQTIEYSPNQVVQLSVITGYQLMVSFEIGEKIETIAVGNSSAWQVTANKRGDAMFIKTIGEGVSTNLTVVTDVRVYTFELQRNSGYGRTQAFLVRFTYPQIAKETLENGQLNVAYHYKISGSRNIRPNKITVEGKQTKLSWPDNRALPAVFKLESDGNEALVNGIMRDGIYIIEGAPEMLVFRIDRQVARAKRIAVPEIP